MLKDHYAEVFLFYLKCVVKVRNLEKVDDIDLFYKWYFDSLKSIFKVRFWQTAQWKKAVSNIISDESVCKICGASNSLLLQHTKPYLRFLYFKTFYNEVSFYSWQKYRKFRKIYGKIPQSFVFPFYKSYLFSYFHYILCYMQLVYVDVYCKKCAYEEDFFLIYGKAYYSFSDSFSDNICKLFYIDLQNTNDNRGAPREDAPQVGESSFASWPFIN